MVNQSLSALYEPKLKKNFENKNNYCICLFIKLTELLLDALGGLGFIMFIFLMATLWGCCMVCCLLCCPFPLCMKKHNKVGGELAEYSLW